MNFIEGCHGDENHSQRQPLGTERDTNMSDLRQKDFTSVDVDTSASDNTTDPRGSLADLGDALDEVKRITDALEQTQVSIEACSARNATDADRIDQLEAALTPFLHDDLCEVLGGNIQGDDSIVFQRNTAKLTLGHFRAARADQTLAPAGDPRTEDALGNPLRYGSSRGFLAKETITMRLNETLDQMIARGLRDGLLEPLPSKPETVEDTGS